MKKYLFAILAALAMLALFAVTALAEGEIPTEPFTWETVLTIGGCTLFALLFVQLIKAPLDKVWKIPTRLLVYVVCLAVMLLGTLFTTGLTWESGLLVVANAVIPTLAAMGAYEVIIGRKTKPPEE